MFRTVSLSIIRSLALYTQQYVQVTLTACEQAVSIICMTYTYCCVYSAKTTDDGQRNCLKHIEFYSKNKLEKLVHLVGFIKNI